MRFTIAGMNKARFVNLLDQISRELVRYSVARLPGDEIWDGERFVKVRQLGEADLAALLWYQKITTISTLIGGQESSVSEKQSEYLNRLLFGGMMSLNDLSFDEEKLGTYAAGLNDRLGELRTQLFTAFHQQSGDETA